MEKSHGYSVIEDTSMENENKIVLNKTILIPFWSFS